MAIIPAPQSKANEIIEALNEMGKSGQIDQIKLARWKHEANQMKQSGQVSPAFIILGMIACLEGDIEQMRSHHLNAIRYASESIDALRNYAVSLKKSGILQDSLEYFKKAHQLEPGHKRCLNDVIESLYDLSLNDDQYEAELEDYARKWEQLTGEPHPLYDDPETLAGMFDAFDEHIKNHPEALVDPGQKFWDEIEKLVEGVGVGE